MSVSINIELSDETHSAIKSFSKVSGVPALRIIAKILDSQRVTMQIVAELIENDSPTLRSLKLIKS